MKCGVLRIDLEIQFSFLFSLYLHLNVINFTDLLLFLSQCLFDFSYMLLICNNFLTIEVIIMSTSVAVIRDDKIKKI